MPLYQYFEIIFDLLQLRDNNIAIMAVFIILHALALLLRIAVFLGYRGHNMLLSVDSAKPLKSLSDTNALKSPLLRRIAIDYINVAEKNPARAPLDAIVSKHILDLSLLGFRYFSLNEWTVKLENGLIIVGLVLALTFQEYGAVYGLLSVAGFLILKLAYAVFSYSTALKLLESDIRIYIEREISSFFAGHTSSAILRFKDEVTEAIDRQAKLLQDATNKLSSDLNMNLMPALSHLGSLKELPKAVDTMLKSNDRYALHHDEFMSQTKIIKETQESLENSLSAYETTLQNLVQTMGSGMGTFIQLHGQNAASSLTTAMQEHIDRITASSQETMTQISALIEQLTNQSRDISSHLRALHERINEL